MRLCLINSRYLRCSLYSCLCYTNLPFMDTKHSSLFRNFQTPGGVILSRSRVSVGVGGLWGPPKRNPFGLLALARAKTEIQMAEVRMNPLPSGYEYEFISTVLDDHHCLICHLPLREPVQTRCGHRFCKKCLDEAIRRYENRNRVLSLGFMLFSTVEISVQAWPGTF